MASLWLPLAVGSVLFATALVTAGVLRAREDEAVERATLSASRRAESGVRRRMADHVFFLEQLAASWERAGGLPEPDWERQAGRLLAHFASVRAVEVVDRSFRVRRVAPREGNEAAVGLDLGADPITRRTLEQSRDQRRALATRPVDLAQGGRGFRISVPLFVGDAFDGFLVAVHPIGPTFDALLQNTLPGFAIRIRDGDAPVYTSAPPVPDPSFSLTAPVRVLNLRWDVGVSPRPEVVDVLRTWIPEMVLYGGGLNAFFLAFAIHQARTSRRRAARLLAETNRVHDEMARREHAEAAEREAREELQAVVASFPDHVWSAHLTPEGGFEPRYYSATVERISGHPRAYFISDPERWIALTHPEDREAVAQGYRDVFSGAQDEWCFEYRIVRPDGEVRAIRDRVRARDIPEGRRLDGVISDTTPEQERQRMEAQLQQTQRLESLGVLAGGIAHDFNNLLVGILGHADLSRSSLPEDSAARRHIGAIEKAARRAAELCRQMLSYAGQGALVTEPVDLRETVEDMAELLATSASKRKLRYDFPDGLPLVEADASQIGQVVMNLITNAAESMEERGGSIDVTARVVELDRAELEGWAWGHECEPGRYVALSVADEGSGMDEETRRRMFEPFFTRKFAGRGLGLAAALGIVRRHHGAIQVESELGQGTRVTLLLPVAEGRAARPRPPTAPVEPLAGEGTVLLVDDEQDAREVGSLLLERAGFRVLTAGDGESAVEAFHAHRDETVCVVLDLTMPGIDGTETVRRIRKLGGDVPVVLCSGFPEDEAMSRFEGLGLAGFVEKPYSTEALLRSVLAAQSRPTSAPQASAGT